MRLPAFGICGALDFTPRLAREEFIHAVHRARDYIAAGDIYQVNLSLPWSARWPEHADALAFYARLRAVSPAPFGAYLDLAATRIPRGDGVVVYVKNRKAPRFTWVVVNGQPYACDRETKGLTPAVPYTSEARWDAWKQTGLDPANTAAFFQIVDAAEAHQGAR